MLTFLCRLIKLHCCGYYSPLRKQITLLLTFYGMVTICVRFGQSRPGDFLKAMLPTYGPAWLQGQAFSIRKEYPTSDRDGNVFNCASPPLQHIYSSLMLKSCQQIVW